MQGAARSLLLNGKNAVLQHVRLGNQILRPIASAHFESTVPARIDEHGFERTTISDILKEKGKGADGSWLWCTVEDTVYDAVKSVCILYLPSCFPVLYFISSDGSLVSSISRVLIKCGSHLPFCR